MKVRIVMKVFSQVSTIPGGPVKQRRHGKRGGSLQELTSRSGCCEGITGVEFCVVFVAAFLQKYARLNTLSHSTGAASRPRLLRGPLSHQHVTPIKVVTLATKVTGEKPDPPPAVS